MNKYSAAIIHYSTEHSKRERGSGVSAKRSWLIWIILFCHGLCEAAHGSQTECPELGSKGGLIQGLTHSLPLHREECYFNRSGEALTEQESTEQTNTHSSLHSLSFEDKRGKRGRVTPSLVSFAGHQLCLVISEHRAGLWLDEEAEWIIQT